MEEEHSPELEQCCRIEKIHYINPVEQIKSKRIQEYFHVRYDRDMTDGS